MKGFVIDSSDSLDSNRERVAFTNFSVDLTYIYKLGKITTSKRKCLGKCMKPEPSEVKTEQSIKNAFNLIHNDSVTNGESY